MCRKFFYCCLCCSFHDEQRPKKLAPYRFGSIKLVLFRRVTSYKLLLSSTFVTICAILFSFTSGVRVPKYQVSQLRVQWNRELHLIRLHFHKTPNWRKLPIYKSHVFTRITRQQSPVNSHLSSRCWKFASRDEYAESRNQHGTGQTWGYGKVNKWLVPFYC